MGCGQHPFCIFMALLEKGTLNVLPKQIFSPLSLLAYLLFCCLSNALLLSIGPFCSELVKSGPWTPFWKFSKWGEAVRCWGETVSGLGLMCLSCHLLGGSKQPWQQSRSSQRLAATNSMCNGKNKNTKTNKPKESKKPCLTFSTHSLILRKEEITTTITSFWHRPQCSFGLTQVKSHKVGTSLFAFPSVSCLLFLITCSSPENISVHTK